MDGAVPHARVLVPRTQRRLFGQPCARDGDTGYATGSDLGIVRRRTRLVGVAVGLEVPRRAAEEAAGAHVVRRRDEAAGRVPGSLAERHSALGLSSAIPVASTTP